MVFHIEIAFDVLYMCETVTVEIKVIDNVETRRAYYDVWGLYENYINVMNELNVNAHIFLYLLFGCSD